MTTISGGDSCAARACVTECACTDVNAVHAGCLASVLRHAWECGLDHYGRGEGVGRYRKRKIGELVLSSKNLITATMGRVNASFMRI